MRKGIVLGIVLTAAIIGGLIWHFAQLRNASDQLTLYGNVDLRQVDLAFNNSQRIAQVLVEEGNHVSVGQLLATLDTGRLAPLVAQAQAQVDAQRQAVARMHHGNRPEEIAEAKAAVESAQADAGNAHRQYDRLKSLTENSAGRAVSQHDLENAKAAMDVADAKLAVSQKALDLEVAGPRAEDVAQAEAQLQGNEAQLALLQQELKDAQLLSPCNGIVRSRLMEAGEMASPAKPVFSLAVTDPKWVRAYVSEPDLNKVKPGMPASIAVDSFPNRRFNGWVGFISPTAEFTPKAVQTEELRSSLVYEVRVFVTDQSDDLRLGAPATVYLSTSSKQATTQLTTGNE